MGPKGQSAPREFTRNIENAIAGRSARRKAAARGEQALHLRLIGSQDDAR